MSSNLTCAKEQRLNCTPTPFLSSNSVMEESSKKLKGRVFGTIEGEFGGQFSQLPEDVVLNILSRLQVKDLIQCRYVRKSWYKGILSPYFSKLHHEKSTSRGTYLASYILQEFNYRDPRVPYDLYMLEFYYSTGTGTYAFDTIPIRSNFKDMGLKYGIVGSCNGLLCLCEPILADPIYICNPLIGEYITLPLSNLTNVVIISGFGFDQITGDYKVIRLTSHKMVLSNAQIHHDLEVEVYTLGSKNWRKIGVAPSLPRGESPGVFLNGVIHWMSDACKILCFDIASEIFSVIKIPPVYNNIETASGSRNVDSLDMRVIKGHLCILDDNLHGVWVMKQYGDDQSWINECLFDGFLCEVRALSSLSWRSPRLRDLCPHVVSFVSHISSEEDASGGEEGSFKLEEWTRLEEWTKTLYPISHDPCPIVRAIGAEEDGGAFGAEEDGGGFGAEEDGGAFGAEEDGGAFGVEEDSDSSDDDDDDDDEKEEQEEEPFNIAEFVTVLKLRNM